MNKEWVESIRCQCEDAGVPFFFKQWGGFQKSKKGRSLNGRTYDQLPARLIVPIPDRTERRRLLGSWSSAFTSDWQEEPA